MTDDEKFDGLLFNLAGQHQGGIFEVSYVAYFLLGIN